MAATAVALGLAGAGPVARGAQIMVGNPSFEQPNDLGAGGSTTDMPSWTPFVNGNQGIFVNDNQNGALGAVLKGVDGKQLSYINAAGNAKNGGNGYFQLLGDKYAAGMSYTLTAAVAEAAGAKPDAGSLFLQLLAPDPQNFGKLLTVASTPIAFNDNKLQGGTLVDYTAVLANGKDVAGQPIYIQVYDDGGAKGGVWDVDNIRLTSANANPEPISLVIASEAVLAGLGIRWLRRKGKCPKFLDPSRWSRRRPADRPA
jgi:hypothetical protein